ncbi:RNA ligase RtcB family protein [Cypionkella sp.]|uniref:RNA ligase RtcB family protein n=1 Tax=Cypionkella sp. TaxID=2811411 RepID=UPI002AB9F1C3|nr:RNA ligase RtcB family protein [Cypionkella sp.]MDZ4393736.1 RNA ligase RtcB family protein [Cypionkella sp.]
MGISHSGPNSLAQHASERVFHYYTPSAWIDGRAEAQLNEVLRLQGVTAVAGYPDLHPGRFGPVGAAMLADRIYPHLVGSDVGCGMSLFSLDLPLRKFSAEKAGQRMRVLETAWEGAESALAAAGIDPAMGFGLGSIGGGNHFCEVLAVDSIVQPIEGLSRNSLCLLVHSGSRSWGDAFFQSLQGHWTDGLLAEGEAGRHYLQRHDVLVAWAKANRLAIATRAAEALRADLHLISDAPHNLVQGLAGNWLHRKGAAVATGGLVPLAGSRDSLSYVVAVTGAAETPFQSLAHGAGRKHDRASMHGRIRKHRSELERLRRNSFGGHILCEDADLLIEEAGSAYKSAANVLVDLQALGLAEPAAALRPLLTYKKTRVEEFL